jgi:hypothetical protein
MLRHERVCRGKFIDISVSDVGHFEQPCIAHGQWMRCIKGSGVIA